MSEPKDAEDMLREKSAYLEAFATAARAIDELEPSEQCRVIAALSALYPEGRIDSFRSYGPPAVRVCVDCGARLHGHNHTRCTRCNKKFSLRPGDFNEYRIKESAGTSVEEPGDG